MIRERALAWAGRYAARRPPDFVIGDRQLERWWLVPRNRWFNVYLHRFRGSDEDRALHDHMYVNASWVLGPGGYWEVVPDGENWQPAARRFGTVGIWRPAGTLVARWPTQPHRIVIAGGPQAPVWSLFVTGPRVREWGFVCPQGWRHWREFTAERDAGKVGRGCE